jgi:hypothetical protein
MTKMRVTSYDTDDNDDAGVIQGEGNTMRNDVEENFGQYQTSYDAYERHANIIEDDSHHTNGAKLEPTREILLWHYRMGHLPFARLQTMARSGSLPNRLQDC